MRIKPLTNLHSSISIDNPRYQSPHRHAVKGLDMMTGNISLEVLNFNHAVYIVGYKILMLVEARL